MHPNEELARRERVINAGDYAALDEIYHPNLVLHYPGRNPLAGGISRMGRRTDPANSATLDFVDRFGAAIEGREDGATGPCS